MYTSDKLYHAIDTDLKYCVLVGGDGYDPKDIDFGTDNFAGLAFLSGKKKIVSERSVIR